MSRDERTWLGTNRRSLETTSWDSPNIWGQWKESHDVRAKPKLIKQKLEVKCPMASSVLKANNKHIPSLQKVLQVEGHLRAKSVGESNWLRYIVNRWPPCQPYWSLVWWEESGKGHQRVAKRREVLDRELRCQWTRCREPTLSSSYKAPSRSNLHRGANNQVGVSLTLSGQT